VPTSLPHELTGPIALVVLALLPGLLIVRSPWWTVPFLSLGFWEVSWWWPIAGGHSRGRFLLAVLSAAGVLLIPRLLPKRRDASDPAPAATRPQVRFPSGPSILLLGVALLTLVPLMTARHAPGGAMAFHSQAALLLVWRDGLPLSYQPLLPVAPFGAHEPAMPLLAADVALVSGLDPARSVLLVALGTTGLLMLALCPLYARWTTPARAAVGAVAGVGLAPWPTPAPGLGGGESAMALAFGAAAAALLLGHRSRWSAAAAGLLLAVSAMAGPLLAPAVLLGSLITRHSGAVGPGARGRFPLATGLALTLAGPYLLRLGRAASPRELEAALADLRPSSVLCALGGLLVLSLLPVLASRLPRGRLGRDRIGAVVLGGLGAALILARTLAWVEAGRLRPDELAALEQLAVTTRPLDVVCAPDGVGDWVPSLSGRAVGGPGPWVPPVLREEAGRAPACTVDWIPAARGR